MRIISKFNDYYDSVQGVMYDSDMVYIRKYNSVYTKRTSYFSSSDFRVHIVCVCGEYYPVMMFKPLSGLTKENKQWVLKNLSHVTIDKELVYYSYDVDLMDEYEHNNSSYRYHRRKNDQAIREHCKEAENWLTSKNFFEEYDTPIFVLKHDGWRDHYLEINATLKDYGFQKIKDPYTIFQDIVMWKNNQAIGDDPDQIEDNVVLRDSKGFDKWSFKKKSSRDGQ